MHNKSRQEFLDIKFMREALKLASSVSGLTSPDPSVGAVIVKGARVISRGYHDLFTTPHAEDFAIKKAGKNARGATLYINLEPCCHYGNNPPCTDNIIKSGIRRVVAAMKDPNPLVNGKGFARLKKAGIRVDVGLLRKEAEKLNEFFIKHIVTGKPFVILKSAMSLDGKIATKHGETRWITGDASRRSVHKLRSNVDAVMVGIDTVIKDDPLLTNRSFKGKKARNPLRVIVDSSGRTPLSSKVLNDHSAKTIVAVTRKANKGKIKKIESLGAEVLLTKSRDGMIDLDDLMSTLGKRKISSVMIEGGGTLTASAIKQGIADKLMFYVSPKIIGGINSPTPVEGSGSEHLSDAVKIREMSVKRIEDDILIEGYIDLK